MSPIQHITPLHGRASDGSEVRLERGGVRHSGPAVPGGEEERDAAYVGVREERDDEGDTEMPGDEWRRNLMSIRT